jgi:dTDP-4-amino-4,6-dideoxygalactose transaminase
MKIEFYKHSIDESDIQNVVKVLRSIFLTTGSISKTFEESFSKFTGIKHTVALSSCTAALHLSLLALGIGNGDEVITTPLTFIATATAILHTGATPVFVDVESTTGLINPNLIEKAITPRTKAIIPVHLYGAMADMKRLRNIADKHNLKIIEDAAHCIEGERDGIKPGYLSDAACFSFYATKNLTCGEGGALITNNSKLANKVRVLRQHGMNKEAADRYHGSYKHWDMIDIGWKYNLDDIHSALLINQLDRLLSLYEQRKKVYNNYDLLIKPIPDINTLSFHGKNAYHLYTILVSPEIRDNLLQSLNKLGVGLAVNYRSIHTLTWFKNKYGFEAEDYPNAYKSGESTISLPFYPALHYEEQEEIIKSLKKIIMKLKRDFVYTQTE